MTLLFRAPPRRPRTPIPAAILTMAATALLGGCGYSQSKLAHQAQYNLIGMSSNDLQACAGPPDKTTKLNGHTQLFTYVYKPSATGGVNVQLPLNLGGIAIGGSGTYCSASMRLLDGHVTEVHYTGDDDRAIGDDGVCEPLIRGCMRQVEPTMRPLEGPQKTPGASAFHPPAVPQQPADAEAFEPATK